MPGSAKLFASLVERRAFALFAAVVLLCYLGIATGGFRQASRGELREGNRYEQLGRAFLKGHLSLGQEGDPAVPSWDLSLYQGRYYLYFGVAPVLLYYVPLLAATGGNGPIPSFPLVVFFCFGTFLLQAQLLRAFRDAFFPGAGRAALGGAFAALAFANGAVVEVNRPALYEVAITGAQFFLFLGIVAFFASFRAPRRRRPLLSLSGTAFAFAVGCRPTALVPILVFASFAGWPLWRERPFPKRALAGHYGIFALGLLALAAYNFARFDSPAEFGQRYQLSVLPDTPVPRFSLPRMLETLPRWLTQLPAANPHFPFLSALTVPNAVYAEPYLLWQERPLGVLLTLPALWFLGPALFRRRLARPAVGGMRLGAGAIVMIFTLMGAAALLALAATPWIIDRYTFDFQPCLLLACLLAFLSWSDGPRLARILAAFTVAVSIYVNTFVAL